jgi:hypothetical protein
VPKLLRGRPTDFSSCSDTVWRPGIAVSVTQRHYVFKLIT